MQIEPPATVSADLPSCSSQGSLRTKETIERFKQVPPQQGTTNPLLVYFGTLLQKGQLNAFESVELSRLVIGQNKKPLLDGWFKEGKVSTLFWEGRHADRHGLGRDRRTFRIRPGTRMAVQLHLLSVLPSPLGLSPQITAGYTPSSLPATRQGFRQQLQSFPCKCRIRNVPCCSWGCSPEAQRTAQCCLP